MNEIVLEIKGISKSYGKKEALNNINLSIERGKIIGLLGPNGSGKTTLIKLINGLLTPNEGEITVDDMLKRIEVFENRKKVGKKIEKLKNEN